MKRESQTFIALILLRMIVSDGRLSGSLNFWTIGQQPPFEYLDLFFLLIFFTMNLPYTPLAVAKDTKGY